MFDFLKWTPISAKRNELTAIYEPVQPYLLQAFTDAMSDAVFLDIGANIGVYSIVMGQHEAIKTINAFEPMPDCCTEVVENARLNGLEDRLTVHRIALSEQKGTAAFRLLAPLSGGNGLADTHLFDADRGKTVDVPIERLDDVVTLSGGEFVAKIDVEGHESGVLGGAPHLLENNKGILQVEIHEDSPSRQDVFDALTQRGYRMIFQVGWDYYFSNLPEYAEDAAVLARVQKGLSVMVEDSKDAPQPARRNLMDGVVIEFSRQRAEQIKRVLRGWRK